MELRKNRGILPRERRRNDCPSLDDYLNMSEEEKDRAIHEAVIRLQTRIHEIIYLLRLEMKHTGIAGGKVPEEREKDPNRGSP